MEQKQEVRKGNMADVICEIATIIAEHGCDPEQLWNLEREQIASAKNLLTYIKAWAEIITTAMPTVVPPSALAWANAEKTCTMVTKWDYSVGSNQAILGEVRRLQGTPDMTAAESLNETKKESKEP